MCLVIGGAGLIGGIVVYVVAQMIGLDPTASILAGIVGGIVVAMIAGWAG